MGKAGRIFFRSSFAVITGAWGTLGGAIGFAIVPLMEGWLPVPIGLGVGAYVALCVALNNATEKIGGLECQLRDAADTKPIIKLDRAVYAPTIKLNDGDEAVGVWELWFKNQPIKKGDDYSTAHGLMAQIQFCTDDWRVVLEFVGMWGISKMPEHRGWLEERDEINLPPTHRRGKLLIVCQPSAKMSSQSTDDELTIKRPIYGLSGENLHADPKHARSPRYEISADVAAMRIKVEASNVEEQVFQFRLERDVEGAITGIENL